MRGKFHRLFDAFREPLEATLDYSNSAKGGAAELCRGGPSPADRFEAGDPGECQDREAIGVARDQDNPVHRPVRRMPGDVEAEPHIVALLFKPRFEVRVR